MATFENGNRRNERRDESPGRGRKFKERGGIVCAERAEVVTTGDVQDVGGWN